MATTTLVMGSTHSASEAAHKRTGLIVIAGPTASGKSVLAMRLAERLGGVVIGADSMQLYHELPILTAQPSAEDRKAVPHRLYGVLGARDAGSVGSWLDLAAAAIAEASAAGAWAIVTGGTGLYLKALLHGIAPVPEIPPGARETLRRSADGMPSEVLHLVLAIFDAEMAARLKDVGLLFVGESHTVPAAVFLGIGLVILGCLGTAVVSSVG